jgi:ATP/maltotriose-dependent transcriptional regulator MalT
MRPETSAIRAHPSRVASRSTHTDPFGNEQAVLDRVRSAGAGFDLDSDAARFLGPAAVVVGAFDVALAILTTAIDGLRAEGRLAHLPRMLVLQGSMAARVANWDVAIPSAAACRRLASELGEPHWIAAAATVASIIAGTRGDEAGAERAAAEAESVAVPIGANTTVAFAQTGRVLAALGAGRHADAYERADRLFDPNSAAYHPVISHWLIAELAEAAVPLGLLDDARRRVEHVEAVSSGGAGTCVAFGLLHARALLAEDEHEAAGRFDEALGADYARWPLQRARLLLSYGRWLRRQRRISESRSPLREASAAFDAMGCMAWAEQARSELRASGGASRRRDPSARDQLTAQELQIAQLAARSLSNREIGQRLYLSHRTVGTHLYRVVPSSASATGANSRSHSPRAEPAAGRARRIRRS